MGNRLFEDVSKLETEAAKPVDSVNPVSKPQRVYGESEEDRMRQKEIEEQTWFNIYNDPDMEQYLRLGFTD